MARFIAGDVVVIRFPFSDLSAAGRNAPGTGIGECGIRRYHYLPDYFQSLHEQTGNKVKSR